MYPDDRGVWHEALLILRDSWPLRSGVTGHVPKFGTHSGNMYRHCNGENGAKIEIGDRHTLCAEIVG